MIDLSSTCASVLAMFRDSGETFPADDLPAGVSIATVEYLFALDLLDRITLVAPGKEAEFYGPRGLVGYRIKESGREWLRLHEELLQQRDQDAADQRAYEDAKACEERAYLNQQTQKQFRHDWRIAAFELIGGFILGAVADHFFDIVGNTTRTVFAVLTSLGLVH